MLATCWLKPGTVLRAHFALDPCSYDLGPKLPLLDYSSQTEAWEALKLAQGPQLGSGGARYFPVCIWSLTLKRQVMWLWSQALSPLGHPQLTCML